MTDAATGRPTLGIAIVNWNAGPHLDRCLESIAASDWSTLVLTAVVVVDNASTDGSADRLERAGPPVTLIRNAENRGFAAACNQAAAQIEADYILFLNPDTRLDRQTVAVAVGWLEDGRHAAVGILGVQLIGGAGEISRSCARFPTLSTMLARVLGLDRLAPRWCTSYVMDDWDHASSREVDHVIGAFYLVRAALFRSLRGFDEAFFVYFEDLDFSMRARRAGWGSYYLAEARAYHKGGGTSDRIKSTRLFYSLRSRLQYVRKHFPRSASAFVTVCTLIVEPPVRIAACLVGGSPTGLRETLEAYRLLWRSGSRAR